MGLGISVPPGLPPSIPLPLSDRCYLCILVTALELGVDSVWTLFDCPKAPAGWQPCETH